MFTVTAEPKEAFRLAVGARLRADAALMAILSGIFGRLSDAARVPYPYLVFGRQSMTRDAGAMGVAGAIVSLQLDGWSDYKGPAEMDAILSRVSVRLERQTLLVPGFVMVEGSLTCELSESFEEADEDTPDLRLVHGVQRWTAEIHEAS